jgi:hypothetical protein
MRLTQSSPDQAGIIGVHDRGVQSARRCGWGWLALFAPSCANELGEDQDGGCEGAESGDFGNVGDERADHGGTPCSSNEPSMFFICSYCKRLSAPLRVVMPEAGPQG